ncbi:response regulator transcription factor [Rhodococcus sp. BP-332]|uniref:response regulator n=1 Tax=Rhodococcus sp. BP-332 TaxID=2739447 RepID=UPI001C9A56DC|nr:response regulator transcription factor [Rhodococcus sp. BP-332]MBY6675423.1 response regulator transcription factor [Rhodococcus sp. BP-332]
MTTVIVADDDAGVRAGVRAILDTTSDIAVVGEAADGTDALRLIAELTPDVALLDVRMPAPDGLEVAATLDTINSVTAAVILTTFDDREYVDAALRADVRGFPLKASDPYELVVAVRAASTGGAYLSPRIASMLVSDIRCRDTVTNTEVRDVGSRLTSRERDVLRLLAHGLTNRQIGDQLHLAESSIKTHVASIFLRLDTTNRVQAAIVAHQLGLV